MSTKTKQSLVGSRVAQKNTTRALSRPSRAHTKPLCNTFTAAIERTEDGWWIGRVLEVPGALSQGRTVDELRENMKEAVSLILECQRDEARRELAGHAVVEEEIVIPVIASS